jgi:hypothetical protein
VQPASPAYTFPWALSVKLIGLARHQFAVLSLAVIALVSSFWFLVDVLGTATRATPSFGVAAFEDRFNGFGKTVQPHTVYGYLSDNPANDPSSLAEFHLTQYVLAPAIVRQSTHENLVIVNYHSKDLDMRLLQANRLKPYRSVGTGIALASGDKPMGDKPLGDKK